MAAAAPQHLAINSDLVTRFAFQQKAQDVHQQGLNQSRIQKNKQSPKGPTRGRVFAQRDVS